MQDYGIGKGSVLRLLAEAGVRMRNQSLSPADLPEAIELYRSGLSLKTVGDHFGLSDDAVRGAFLRAGVQLRPRTGWNYDAWPDPHALRARRGSAPWPLRAALELTAQYRSLVARPLGR